MKRIIKDAKVVDDDWIIVTSDEVPGFALPAGEAKLIVPLALYSTLQKAAGPNGLHQRLGLLLGPDDAPEDVLPFLAQLPVIAVHFPSFTDGRGYSVGKLVRVRYGFTGELRAVGDVLRDQLYFLKQCGFNAFELRSGKEIEEALGAFDDYAWSSRYSSHAGDR